MRKRYQGSYLAYFLMYGFYYLSWSLFSTLISIYLINLGYRHSQVSLVVSMSFFASMLAQPVIGRLNDNHNVKKVSLLLFSLTLLGAALMVMAPNLWVIVLAYSWVLLLFNGTNPVLEQIATTSPFAYGKIRIWGTIGFAVGSQLSGFIYEQVSARAIFITYMGTMLLAILGVWGTIVGDDKPVSSEKTPQEVVAPKVEGVVSPLKNQTYLAYVLLAAIYAGVMNAGHTYIPAMLENAGLSVSASTTVVSLAVLCEMPVVYFSYLFMDKFTSRQLMNTSMIFICLQYLIYSLNLGIVPMVIITLMTKHAATMLFIMVNMKIVNSLVDKKVLITGLAIVQTGRNLASIISQNIAGQILNISSYQTFSAFVAITVLVVFILFKFVKLPSGQEEKLFSK